MKPVVFLAVLLCLSIAAHAQQATTADTAFERVISRLYEVISGPPGPRDWDAFRGLFHPKAGMGAVVQMPGKPDAFKRFSPEDYIRMNGPYFLEHGFREREIGRQVFRYGNIAQVASAYESEIDGRPEKERGINAIQLIREGERWLVLSIIWQEETKGNPLPVFK